MGLVLVIEERSIKYGYQGNFAEKDEETGWNSFELRMYDGVIFMYGHDRGRFADGMRSWADGVRDNVMTNTQFMRDWSQEQSNALTEANRIVNSAMQPAIAERVGVMKDLYTIQAMAGGSGMDSGLRLATNTLTLQPSVPSVIGKGYEAIAKLTVHIKKNMITKSP